MTAIIVTLAVLALVGYGLESNHRRAARPGARLAGSTDVEDRDVTRVTTDLHAAAAHTSPDRPAITRRVAPVHAVLGR
ncbi:hypothetical protein ACFXGA_23620 [Actinosynnema sp. NPDC059335]|uniref:hypothetical protein n=1 Tax=Actinosynnema sp. NPDC059335 TaxID=3346804 RepID=UPI00367327E2